MFIIIITDRGCKQCPEMEYRRTEDPISNKFIKISFWRVLKVSCGVDTNGWQCLNLFIISEGTRTIRWQIWITELPTLISCLQLTSTSSVKVSRISIRTLANLFSMFLFTFIEQPLQSEQRHRWLLWCTCSSLVSSWHTSEDPPEI